MYTVDSHSYIVAFDIHFVVYSLALSRNTTTCNLNIEEAFSPISVHWVIFPTHMFRIRVTCVFN